MGTSNVELTEVAYRIGWTLIHSLWEGTAVALALAFALAAMRRRSAQARYVASLASLGLIVGAAAATFRAVVPPHGNRADVLPVPAAVIPSAVDPNRHVELQASLHPVLAPSSDGSSVPKAGAGQVRATPAPASTPLPDRLKARLDPALPWLSVAWAAGVALLSLWHAGGWIAAQRLRVLGVRPPNAAVTKLAADLSARFRFRSPIRVAVSIFAQTPMVIGWLRPVVLLPAAIVTGLTPGQLEGILAHELAHIRRHDYLVNLFQVLAETLLFYHPAVWWISRRVRLEREQRCDEIAVRACGDRCTYAESLAALEEVRLNAALALAAGGSGGGELVARIRKILRLDDPAPRGTARVCVAAIVLLLAAAIPISLLRGAPATTPTTGRATRTAASDEHASPDHVRSRDGDLLKDRYALVDGEVLRLVKPPFPGLRTTVVRDFYGTANATGVRSVVFHLKDGHLYPGAWSYRSESLDWIALDLGCSWQEIDLESLQQIRWPPDAGDIVVCDEATPEQKFDALAALIERETGQKITAAKVRRTVPCIVLHGGTNRPGYACIDAEGRGAYALFVTALPLDGATLARYAERLTLQGPMGRPNDTRRGNRDTMTFNLGAPFIHDGASDGQFWRTSVFFVFDDVAALHPTDTEYADKVRRVLDNIQKQIGGDWRLENGAVEQYTLQPAAGRPPAHARPAERSGGAPSTERPSDGDSPQGPSRPASAPAAPATRASSPRPAILLVTSGNYFLDRALDHLGLGVVDAVAPNEFDAYEKAHPMRGGVIVFDRWAPKAAPSEPAMYVDAIPPESGVNVERDAAGHPVEMKNGQDLDWSINDRILKGMEFRNALFVAEALKLHVPADWRTLASNADGKFIVAHDAGGTRQIVIAFDVQQSNWPFQPSLPMFLHRAVRWLMNEEPAPVPGPPPPPPATGPAAAPATQQAAAFTADCVLSGIVDGKRNVLATPTLNVEAVSKIGFVYPGKPPVIVERQPGGEAGIVAELQADEEPGGRVRIVCRLQRRGTPGNADGKQDDALLEARKQMVESEWDLRTATRLQDELNRELDHRRIGITADAPYAADEIAQVDPSLGAKLKERTEEQMLYHDLLTRYGTNYPKVLEVHHRLQIGDRDIAAAVKRFNEEFLILRRADGQRPRAGPRDLSKMQALVDECRKRYDAAKGRVDELATAAGTETDQIVKLGEPVAVELADGSRLEVSVRPADH